MRPKWNDPWLNCFQLRRVLTYIRSKPLVVRLPAACKKFCVHQILSVLLLKNNTGPLIMKCDTNHYFQEIGSIAIHVHYTEFRLICCLFSKWINEIWTNSKSILSFDLFVDHQQHKIELTVNHLFGETTLVKIFEERNFLIYWLIITYIRKVMMSHAQLVVYPKLKTQSWQLDLCQMLQYSCFPYFELNS